MHLVLPPLLSKGSSSHPETRMPKSFYSCLIKLSTVTLQRCPSHEPSAWSRFCSYGVGCCSCNSSYVVLRRIVCVSRVVNVRINGEPMGRPTSSANDCFQFERLAPLALCTTLGVTLRCDICEKSGRVSHSGLLARLLCMILQGGKLGIPTKEGYFGEQLVSWQMVYSYTYVV